MEMSKTSHESLRTSDDEEPPRPRYDYPKDWEKRPLHPDIQKMLDHIRVKYPITEEVEAEGKVLYCTCLTSEDGGTMIECSNRRACQLRWYQ